MRLSKLALVIVALAAVAAAAQTSPMQGVRNQLGVGPTATPQTGGAAPAQTSAKPMASPMSPKMSKSAAKPAAAKSAKSAAAPEMGRHSGKRDPFVNPVVRAVAGGGPVCDTGKRCLAISDMSLKGIVAAASGMIAVVENHEHQTYFLRENDPVFNGF